MQSPIPTDEEALAVVSAALMAILGGGSEGSGPDLSGQERLKAWRFSGRWWTPSPLSRPRP